MSDSTSEVTSKAKKLRLNPWLRVQLTEGVPGLEWHDEQRRIFKISFVHCSKKEWTRTNAEIFKRWAIHTGKVRDQGIENYSVWKRNLRCALNKAKDIDHITKDITGNEDTTDENPFRFYQFKQENKQKEIPIHVPDTSTVNLSPTELLYPCHILGYSSSDSESVSIENESLSQSSSSQNHPSPSHSTASPSSTNEPFSDLPDETSIPLEDIFNKLTTSKTDIDGGLPLDLYDLLVQPLAGSTLDTPTLTRQTIQPYTNGPLTTGQMCALQAPVVQSVHQEQSTDQTVPLCLPEGPVYTGESQPICKSQNQAVSYKTAFKVQRNTNQLATSNLAAEMYTKQNRTVCQSSTYQPTNAVNQQKVQSSVPDHQVATSIGAAEKYTAANMGVKQTSVLQIKHMAQHREATPTTTAGKFGNPALCPTIAQSDPNNQGRKFDSASQIDANQRLVVSNTTPLQAQSAPNQDGGTLNSPDQMFPNSKTLVHIKTPFQTQNVVQTNNDTSQGHIMQNTLVDHQYIQGTSNHDAATIGANGIDNIFHALIDETLKIDDEGLMELIMPQTDMNSGLQKYTNPAPSPNVPLPNITEEQNAKCFPSADTPQCTFSTEIDNSKRKARQSKRKRYSMKKPHTITNLPEFTCNCANGMVIEINYKGKTMDIWHSNNPVGCRIIPKSGCLLEQEICDDQDAEDKYGKQFQEMDTITMPDWPQDHGTGKDPQYAQKYLQNALRGIILKCNDSSISVIRLCQIMVYSSVPVNEHHKIERSSDQKPVEIFNFENNFKREFNCYIQSDKKKSSRPNPGVSLNIGQKPSSDSILIMVKVSSCKALSVLRCHKKQDLESLSLLLSSPDQYDQQIVEQLGNLTINQEHRPNKRMA